ncbi:MAG: cyclase family protein [Bacteroidota bacterium]
MFDLTAYHLHDLTHSFDNETEGFSTKATRNVEKDGWNAANLSIYSHAGTHMDAPLHFGVSQQSIDQIGLRDMMGTAWLIRVNVQEKQQLITIKDLGKIQERFQPGDSLLIHTNWSLERGESHYRSGLPRISEELAGWCVDHQVKILGVEPASVADVNNLPEVTQIHQILLGGGVVIVEGLVGLDQIMGEQVFLMALPLKVKGGDGAPARVIAFEKKALSNA